MICSLNWRFQQNLLKASFTAEIRTLTQFEFLNLKLSNLPCVQEKWEPESVKLIWDLRVEERQESTDIIYAVHLREDR